MEGGRNVLAHAGSARADAAMTAITTFPEIHELTDLVEVCSVHTSVSSQSRLFSRRHWARECFPPARPLSRTFWPLVDTSFCRVMLSTCRFAQLQSRAAVEEEASPTRNTAYSFKPCRVHPQHVHCSIRKHVQIPSIANVLGTGFICELGSGCLSAT